MGGAAPLFGLPEAPVPAGMAAWWFDGADGARLRAALLPASGAPRGSVVLSPGRTEPIEKNFETAQRLADGGFAVLVHDWRGQGLSQRALSDRLLGHAEGYEPFLCDYEALLDTFGGDLPWPWIALGHSMGGALTLLALAKGEGRFAGAVLSAPMMGVLTGQVPRPVARGLASLLTSIGRGGRPVFGPPGAPAPFEANVLTHDPVRYARNLALVAQAPDLALGLPTWGWLAFAFAAARELERGPGPGGQRRHAPGHRAPAARPPRDDRRRPPRDPPGDRRPPGPLLDRVRRPRRPRRAAALRRIRWRPWLRAAGPPGPLPGGRGRRRWRPGRRCGPRDRPASR